MKCMLEVLLKGSTLLHKPKLVSCMLMLHAMQGCDVTAQDDNGRTAVSTAVAWGHTAAAVQILTTNSQISTAELHCLLVLAAQQGWADIITYLVQDMHCQVCTHCSAHSACSLNRCAIGRASFLVMHSTQFLALRHYLHS